MKRRTKTILSAVLAGVLAVGIFLFVMWPVSYHNDPSEAAPCSTYLIYAGKRYCFHYEYSKTWFPPAGYSYAGELTKCEVPDEDLECTFTEGTLYYNRESPHSVCIRLDHWNRFTSAYHARYLMLEYEPEPQ